MGNIFNADKLYFDEATRGISTGIRYDTGFYLFYSGALNSRPVTGDIITGDVSGVSVTLEEDSNLAEWLSGSGTLHFSTTSALQLESVTCSNGATFTIEAIRTAPFNWDLSDTEILMTLDTTLGTDKYYLTEVLDVDMQLDITVDENYSKYVDLMELVPSKFRDSVSLQEFLDEAGIDVGTWLGYINDLQDMIDKYKVGEDYIQYLADLVGLKLINTQTTSVILDKRRQLVQVIDWYKMKGTYAAMLYIGYILNLTLYLWDRYTSDYAVFYAEQWYAGKVNEMPTDLPHIDELYTKLVLHCDGIEGSTTFTDSSLSTVTNVITATDGAHVTTGEFKFGTGSCQLDGVTAYLSVDSSTNFDFGIKDFTVDLQVKFNSLLLEQDFIGRYQDANNYYRFYKESNANGNKLHMYFVNDSTVVGDYVMTNDWSGSDLNWHDIIFVRNGLGALILIDGIAQTITETVSFDKNNLGEFTAPLTIGQFNGTNFLNGFLDEIVIFNGLARFTTDFTPFAIPYQHFYKSPYIGLEVVLNQVYGESPDKHLIETPKYDDLALYVELVRPVNVVPIYSALLLPQTTESGEVVEIDGEIKTCTIGGWDFSKDYWDQGQVISGAEINFDNGEHFDPSRNTFLQTITKWKLGTGNKEVSPDSSGFDIENEILSGDIDKLTILSDRTVFEFEVASGTEYLGISELALYLTDNTTIVLGSTFPDIDLAASVSLKVTITIYR